MACCKNAAAAPGVDAAAAEKLGNTDEAPLATDDVTMGVSDEVAGKKMVA